MGEEVSKYMLTFGIGQSWGVHSEKEDAIDDAKKTLKKSRDFKQMGVWKLVAVVEAPETEFQVKDVG